MKELLYGAAYYDEYMPYDRLDKDVEMMKKAGINTVRIAESTWSTCEPQPGIFDFSPRRKSNGRHGGCRNQCDHWYAYLRSSYLDGEGASGCAG